jgi:hypothetical protein
MPCSSKPSTAGASQHDDGLVPQHQVADLEVDPLGQSHIDHVIAGPRARRLTLRFHGQRLGGCGREHAVAAGVEDEQIGPAPVHLHVGVDVIVEQLERHRGAAGRIEDPAIRQH